MSNYSLSLWTAGLCLWSQKEPALLIKLREPQYPWADRGPEGEKAPTDTDVHSCCLYACPCIHTCSHVPLARLETCQ